MKLVSRTLGAVADAVWLRQQFTFNLDILQDVRFGLRQLRKNPGFTAVAVLTLALGIGATTATFSIVHGILIRPLPFDEPDRLVLLGTRNSPQSSADPQLSYLDFQEIGSSTAVFEDMAALFTSEWTLAGTDTVKDLRGLRVTPNFFGLLGVQLELGPGFQKGDAGETSDRQVLLSHRIWQSQFGGDRNIVGRSVTLNGQPHAIVGVVPPTLDFELPLSESYSISGTDVWAPLLPSHPFADRRSVFAYEVLARLNPDTGIDRARSELSVLAEQFQRAYPDSNGQRTFWVRPLHAQVTGYIRNPLLFTFGSVGFMLLITCVNVAALLLARGSERGREIAIRTAIGASRGRITRQLLTENFILASLGGLLGSVVAVWGHGLLMALAPANTPRVESVEFSYPVMFFSAALTLLTGLAFGGWPAWVAYRSDFQQVLVEGGERIMGGRQSRLRTGLVAVEVALAFLLVLGTGLFGGSLYNLLIRDKGYDAHNLLVLQTKADATRYPLAADVFAFYDGLQTRLERLPGVSSVGIVSSLPLSGHTTGSEARIEGRPISAGQAPPTVGWQAAQIGYFETMRIPLRRGRLFEREDLQRPQHVTLLNEAAAALLFPGENPIGKRIALGPASADPDWHEVIGVIGNVSHRALDTPPEPRAYDLMGQGGSRSMFIVARTTGDPLSLAGSVQHLLAVSNPEAPVPAIRPFDELVADAVGDRRFLLLVVGGFALVALTLASMGTYGIISYSVRRRMHEFGIRMALGATPRSVIQLVLQQGARMVFTGLSIGGLGAVLASRLVRSLFFGVSALSPAYMASTGLVVAAAALAACYLPARRATKVDPMVALRYE